MLRVLNDLLVACSLATLFFALRKTERKETARWILKLQILNLVCSNKRIERCTYLPGFFTIHPAFLFVAVFLAVAKTNGLVLSFGVLCKMELECAIMPPGIFDEED